MPVRTEMVLFSTTHWNREGRQEIRIKKTRFAKEKAPFFPFIFIWLCLTYWKPLLCLQLKLFIENGERNFESENATLKMPPLIIKRKIFCQEKNASLRKM